MNEKNINLQKPIQYKLINLGKFPQIAHSYYKFTCLH